MPKFEIINPSDEAYLEAEFKPAYVATMIYSSPAYGLEEVDGDRVMPITMDKWQEWFQDEFGQPLDECFRDVGVEAVIQALESVELARERTSMNDFAGRAHEYAEKLREMDEAELDSFMAAAEPA